MRVASVLRQLLQLISLLSSLYRSPRLVCSTLSSEMTDDSSTRKQGIFFDDQLWNLLNFLAGMHSVLVVEKLRLVSIGAMDWYPNNKLNRQKTISKYQSGNSW